MKRNRGPVYPLGGQDTQTALALCGFDPIGSVFVASRIQEGGLFGGSNAALGYVTDGTLRALCWKSANIVPLFADQVALDAFAAKLLRARASTASILGPANQVLPLWERLRPHWGQPRTVRNNQPLMAMQMLPSEAGTVELNPTVRLAQPRDVDALVPAAAHMFTHEIGYPPYTGSSRGYRSWVRSLVDQGRTYVATDGGRVIFKADIGSVALGISQLQGVWLEPSLRGHGLSAGLIAAAVESSMHHHAPTCTLYVNDFNQAAIRSYQRIGFMQVGTYATVLL